MAHKYAVNNKNSKRYNFPIYKAMRKYGFENFTIEKVYECKSYKEMDLMEQSFIWLLGSDIKELGYNSQSGGKKSFTLSQANKDKIRKTQIGDRNSIAKLNWETVEKIRKEYASGSKQKQLALKYNVSRPNISSVVNNKTWKI